MIAALLIIIILILLFGAAAVKGWLRNGLVIAVLGMTAVFGFAFVKPRRCSENR